MHIDVSLLAASAAYALALEPVRPWYERHRLTAATVAGGVALTGLALDRALRRELPHETRQRVMGHYWRLFAVAGLPIVTWQALILGKDHWEWEALWRG